MLPQRSVICLERGAAQTVALGKCNIKYIQCVGFFSMSFCLFFKSVNAFTWYTKAHLVPKMVGEHVCVIRVFKADELGKKAVCECAREGEEGDGIWLVGVCVCLLRVNALEWGKRTTELNGWACACVLVESEGEGVG
jgi:hypothetical protein